jgi:hypothetical protein
LQGVEAALLLDGLYVVARVVGGSDASTALGIPDATNRLQYAFDLHVCKIGYGNAWLMVAKSCT